MEIYRTARSIRQVSSISRQEKQWKTTESLTSVPLKGYYRDPVGRDVRSNYDLRSTFVG